MDITLFSYRKSERSNIPSKLQAEEEASMCGTFRHFHLYGEVGFFF